MSVYYTEKTAAKTQQPPPAAPPQPPAPEDPHERWLFQRLAHRLRPELKQHLHIKSNTLHQVRVSHQRKHTFHFAPESTQGKGAIKLENMAADQQGINAYLRRMAEGMYVQGVPNLAEWARSARSLAILSAPQPHALVSPRPGIARVFTCATCSGKKRLPCGRCGTHGEHDCSSCNGRGSQSCSSCGGEGTHRCSRCGGSGQISEMLHGKIHEPFAKNVLTHQGFGWYTCPSCHGKGTFDCHACNNGKVVCSGCGGAKRVTCRNCGGAGYNNCKDCDATGLQHQIATPACIVSTNDTSTYGGDPVDGAMLGALSITERESLGDYSRTDVACTQTEAVITYVQKFSRKTIVLDCNGTEHTMHWWGPKSHTHNNPTIFDALIEPDIIALESAVIPKRSWWKAPANVPYAVDQLLASPVFHNLANTQDRGTSASLEPVNGALIIAEGLFTREMLLRGLEALRLAASHLLTPLMRPSMVLTGVLASGVAAFIYLAPASLLFKGFLTVARAIAQLKGDTLQERYLTQDMEELSRNPTGSLFSRGMLLFVALIAIWLLWMPIGWFQRRRLIKGRYRELLASAKTTTAFSKYARRMFTWLAFIWIVATAIVFFVQVLPTLRT